MRSGGQMKIGRTMLEKREQPEKLSERILAHKKGRARRILRVVLVTMVFAAVFGVILAMIMDLSRQRDVELVETVVVPYKPTIEVIDENVGEMQGQLTARMSEYIGQAEADFRELGYTPVRAVIPSGAIREVDFYLEGYNGRIKLTIDRGTGVSVEDADRMIRYLKGIGRMDFEYVDVRIEGKGYWK